MVLLLIRNIYESHNIAGGCKMIQYRFLGFKMFAN